MKSPSPNDHIACQSFQRFVIEALGVRKERTCPCLAEGRDMMCQWYPALAPPIVALYAQATEFRQALLHSFQKSDSLHERARWVNEEENARPESSSEDFPLLDPATMAVDKSESILANAVQGEDLEFGPCLEVGPGTCINSSHLKAIDDQKQDIDFQGTRTSMGGRPRRTVPPQMTVCTNLHQKDGVDRGFNQRLRPHRAATYDRETIVESFEHSSNTEDGRSPTIDFEPPFQEAQAVRQQITLPENPAESAVGREQANMREPDDYEKVRIQDKKHEQELRGSAGRYEFKDQVNDEEGAKDEADGEEGDNSYEGDETFIERFIADVSKLEADWNLELRTPITTMGDSLGESYWHKYDMKYRAMTRNQTILGIPFPDVSAVRVWRRLNKRRNSGQSRRRRERGTHLRHMDGCIQIAQKGIRYEGCRCHVHQGMYEDWPEYDAELTIAQCMRTCVYCGNVFRSASELRRHLRRNKYARKNIRVYQEQPGKKNPTTPSWTPQVKTIDSDQSSIERVSTSHPIPAGPEVRLTQMVPTAPRLW